MTYDEIKKALECCIKDDCDNCPDTFGNCEHNAMVNALAYINQLESENKRLNKKVEELSEVLSDSIKIKVKEIKSEAIKEFAEKIKASKDTLFNNIYSGFHFNVIIDSIAKEMVGENNV